VYVHLKTLLTAVSPCPDGVSEQMMTAFRMRAYGLFNIRLQRSRILHIQAVMGGEQIVK
jgi:hypothetical protein